MDWYYCGLPVRSQSFYSGVKFSQKKFGQSGVGVSFRIPITGTQNYFRLRVFTREKEWVTHSTDGGGLKDIRRSHVGRRHSGHSLYKRDKVRKTKVKK